MKILNGGIRIEDSNLRNLSFFSMSTAEPYFGFNCKTNGLIIRNNSILTDAEMLWHFYYFQEDTNDCEIVIENNPKLDAETLCDYGFLYLNFDIKVNGNMRDCGCNKTQCRVMFNGLMLSDMTNNSETDGLSNFTEIRGDISVENTNFTDLSFLKNLKRIKISDAGLHEKISINIRNNMDLKHLGIDSLKSIKNVWQSEIYANLENLHEDFCLTTRELTIFLEQKIFFVNIHAKLCEETGKLDGIKLCHFESLTSLNNNCEIVLGDVRIESGDEGFVKKLRTVTHVFGTISVQNTTLKNLQFLENLSYIVSLGTEQVPLLQIIGNMKLTDAYLPLMKHVISRTEFYVLVHNNNKDLTNFAFNLFGYELPWFDNYVGGDWGCPSDKLNLLGDQFFRTCKILTNGLNLKNVSETNSLNFLSNIKTIKGEVEITNSQFQNLSFLENLKEIVLGETTSGMSINIHHNPKMIRLGWKRLKTISFIKPVTVNLEQLHPDFCLAIQELVVFLNAAAYFRHLHAKICDFNQSDFEIEVCRFKNLSVLEPDCVYIVGDLNINNGDEELVQKLEKVEILFGSLVIQNTLLKNLDFLGNLRKISNFNETAPIIKIINNENLRKIELLKMDFQTRTNVSYNGGNCRSFNEVSGGWRKSYNVIVQFVIVFKILR
ncbi:unnamed protein product [Caenorhabditis brenneri]